MTRCNRKDDCWGTRFAEKAKDWPEKDLTRLVPYFSSIERAIEKAFQDTGLMRLENGITKMACLECEEKVYFAPLILDIGLSTYTVYWKVYRFITRYRVGSIFEALVRQMEAGHVHHKNILEVYDEEHEMMDYGEVPSGDHLLFNQKNIGQASPEEILLTEERLDLLRKAISQIESSKTSNAPIHASILKLQLSGIDVGREHAFFLGVSEDDVAPLKCQAFKRLCRVMAKFDPSLTKRQRAYNDEKVIEREFERSNFAQRLRQYYPSEDKLREREPRTIREWYVTTGERSSNPSKPITTSELFVSKQDNAA